MSSAKKRKTLIVNSSWEKRFITPISRDVISDAYGKVLIINTEPDLPYSKVAVEEIRRQADRRGVFTDELFVSLIKPHELRLSIDDFLKANLEEEIGIVLDYSTMPREVLWQLMSALLNRGLNFTARYYRPKRYSKEWLTANPIKPRLVLEHSGICKLGRRNALCITPGFDLQRTIQMIYHYEPAITHLIYQPPTHYRHLRQGITKHIELLEKIGRTFGKTECQFYNRPLSKIVAEIKKIVYPLSKEFNLILASLGPKPSAIAYYEIWRKNKNIALSYSASREFNKYYSSGCKIDVPAVYRIKA